MLLMQQLCSTPESKTFNKDYMAESWNTVLGESAQSSFCRALLIIPIRDQDISELIITDYHSRCT